jgi:hypothetical protein
VNAKGAMRLTTKENAAKLLKFAMASDDTLDNFDTM